MKILNFTFLLVLCALIITSCSEQEVDENLDQAIEARGACDAWCDSATPGAFTVTLDVQASDDNACCYSLTVPPSMANFGFAIHSTNFIFYPSPAADGTVGAGPTNDGFVERGFLSGVGPHEFCIDVSKYEGNCFAIEIINPNNFLVVACETFELC